VKKRQKKAAKQNPLSIWKYLSYTLEDGHVDRNM
jgi:hypothetical protein